MISLYDTPLKILYANQANSKIFMNGSTGREYKVKGNVSCSTSIIINCNANIAQKVLLVRLSLRSVCELTSTEKQFYILEIQILLFMLML